MTIWMRNSSALRRLRLLEDLLDRGGGPDHDVDGRAEQQLELVDHENVGRVGHDDLEAGGGAHPRHEVVAEHQVDRDRAEQLGVDLEVLEIDVLDPDALGQAPRLERLREHVRPAVGVEAGRRERLVGARLRLVGHRLS